MSAYPSYSQAPSTSGYYQQPASSSQIGYQQYQAYYQQPSAAPVSIQYSDEQYFRHDYARRLSALTFNSRPLIQELSILAQTYSQTMSRVVIESIEQQLRMVSNLFYRDPSKKLLQRHLMYVNPENKIIDTR
jgi:pre-mRNA cleavage complex 2 protein Pcf11